VSNAVIIDGKAFAAQLRQRVAAAVESFIASTARKPGLAVVLVGEDPASQVYVGSKKKATVEAGMNSFEHRLPASVSQDDSCGGLDDDPTRGPVHGLGEASAAEGSGEVSCAIESAEFPAGVCDHRYSQTS
jgi:5,10-methylene-tetrahydrofolate dehydrogenase/methenyl tetrahydrofolate cyclohydrolase